jgi:drug/metabolite transporter (DMT)-like permease
MLLYFYKQFETIKERMLMKSLMYAVIAMVLYAIQNTVIDVKLKQYSTLSLLLWFYIVLLPLAAIFLGLQKLTGQDVSLPSGNTLKLVILVATMFFIADFFFVGAYTSGGDVVAITVTISLMPVVGALIKYFWVKETLTRYHFGAIVLGLSAVVLVAIGNSKKPADKVLEKQSSQVKVAANP